MGDNGRGRGRKAAATNCPQQPKGRGRGTNKPSEGEEKPGVIGSAGKQTTGKKAPEKPLVSLKPEKDRVSSGQRGKAAETGNAAGQSTVKKKLKEPVQVAQQKKVNRNTEECSLVRPKTPAGKAKNETDGARRLTASSNDRAVLCRSITGKGSYLRAVVESLKLKMGDISCAAGKVNDIVKLIISEVSRQDKLFQGMDKMSSGSYYEGVKISRPNEFDIMLKIPPLQRVDLIEVGDNGIFYLLQCRRQVEGFVEPYVDGDDNISAKIILTLFTKLVKQAVSGREVTVERRNPKSPALTLLIKNSPAEIAVDLVLALEIKKSWPGNTKDGMNIDQWLGKKVKRDLKFKSFYMVPKQCDEERTVKDTWRISFSHIEKEILTNHGSVKTCCESGGEKCCRKPCLKLLKYLLEQIKNNERPGKKLEPFCSYHAKTALLQQCIMYTSDDEWRLEDLEICFNRYVDYFLDCLKKGRLQNFFIPSHNLFSANNINCKLLYDAIREQKKNNYPLFDL
ncbi:cyclic GMP-AMP synthase-like [Hyperolius riggenbachi]|uniref:cyclic GMP-AMP synthase-like n=1 Tax=Hyperolius riggenbachi TaxID=752182 RepID=UPI0035A38080